MKNTKQFKYALFLNFFLFSLIAIEGFTQYAKTPVLDATYTNGTQEFYVKSITKTDASGNVYVGGATLNGLGNYDLLLTKYSSTGVWAWTNQYAGAGNGDDALVNFVVDASLNVFVVGTVYTSATNKNDILTIKYNSGGIQQWLQTYNAPASGLDVGGDIVVGNNNIYITGGVQTTNGFSDFATIKYNSTGVFQWVRTYDSVGLYDGAQKITYVANGIGEITVAGGAQQALTTWKYAARKYDANGTVLNTTVSGGSASGVDEVHDLTKDAAGNIYLTGSIVNVGTGNDMYTVKLNAADLSIAWTAIYNSSGSQTDKSNSVTVDASNNVYITGYSQHATQGKNYTTIKYNSSGVQQWIQSYNGEANGDDEGAALLFDNNFVYVTGTSKINGNKDYYTICYTSTGTKSWAIGYNGSNNKDDIATAIAIDNAKSIIVAGQSNLAPTNNTYTTVKYLQKDYYKPVSTELNSSNMGYVENRGQVRNSNGTSNIALRFYNDKSSPATYLDDAKIGYVWNKSADSTNADTLYRVDMQFNKGNTGKKLYPVDFKKEYYNFYIKPLIVGKERTLACNSVVKFDAYTNTDIVFTHNRKGYKTYIIARSGAPTANFEMQYTGQSSLTVNSSGALVIGTNLGSKIQPKAKAYTMNNTTGVMTLLGWQPTYIITGGNKVSFTYGTWPVGCTLVIQMEQADGNGIQGIQAVQNVDWSTHFGGGGGDENFDVVNTASNQVYSCGTTYSLEYPLFNGTLVTQYVGSFDGFVVKFNQNCEGIWYTYYGGDGEDVLYGIDLENETFVAAVGYTKNADMNFSTTGLNLTEYHGVADGLYLRFNIEGDLIADSYIGGTAADRAFTIKTTTYFFGGDDAPTTFTFIGGSSNNASQFPIHSWVGAYNQSLVKGPSDGFIFVFDNATNNPIWSTFYGGDGYDKISDIAFKYDGGDANLVITGITTSGTNASQSSGNPICGVPLDGGFPDCATTYYPNAYHQPLYIEGQLGSYGNHFISEFESTNFKLIWGTYYGSVCDRLGINSVYGRKNSIAGTFPNSGNKAIYITGCADRGLVENFAYLPSSLPNAYNQPYGTTTNDDGFIAKFNYDNSLQWSTFIGGDGRDVGQGLTVGGNGNVFVTGTTLNTTVQNSMDYCSIPDDESFPLCDNNGNSYIENNLTIGERTFIMAFNSNNNLLWSTQYGNLAYCYGNGVSVSNNKLFLTGRAYGYVDSPPYTLVEYDLNSDLDYYQSLNWGNGDGTMARFSISDLTTGLNDNKNDNESFLINGFPNPAKDKIEIVSNKSFQKDDVLLITDILGKIVIKFNLDQSENSATIDVSKLSSGMFIVQIISKGTSPSFKFFKE